MRKILLLLLMITLILGFQPVQLGAQSREGQILYGGEINSLAWSPDGELLAIQGRGGVRIFNSDLELVVTLEDITTPYEHLEAEGLDPDDFSEWDDNLWIDGIAWSPDSTEIVAPFYSTTGGFHGSGWKIWNRAGNNYELILGEHGLGVAIAWSRDGTKIASTYLAAHYNGCSCTNITLWNIQENMDDLPSPNGTFGTNELPIFVLVWHPDNLILASAGVDCQINIWDTQTKELLYSYSEHTGAVNAIVWNSSGTHLASASDDATIRIWDFATGETIMMLEGHEGAVNALDWNADGTLIASAGDDATVRIWDVATGENILVLEGHEDSIHALDWSPDDRQIATASRDDTVRLWEIELKEQH